MAPQSLRIIAGPSVTRNGVEQLDLGVRHVPIQRLHHLSNQTRRLWTLPPAGEQQEQRKSINKNTLSLSLYIYIYTYVCMCISMYVYTHTCINT